MKIKYIIYLLETTSKDIWSNPPDIKIHISLFDFDWNYHQGCIDIKRLLT